MTENYDRLIDNKVRRHKGEFYTPLQFASYAHHMISAEVGNNWIKDFVVWDPACGTKNLTKELNIEKLYCSTLNKDDLDNSQHLNIGGISFQFDFLNDDLDEIPDGLLEAFKNNESIIILMNPPYSTPSDPNHGENRAGVGSTKIKELMIKNKIGQSAQNLYTQFLYRVCLIKKRFNLDKLYLCIFTPSLFLTGSGFKGLRNIFFNEFSFISGALFNASHFSDVTSKWGVAVNIWSSGKTLDINYFSHKLIDSINGSFPIEIGSKVLYNLDNKVTASDYIKRNIKKLKTEKGVQLRKPCEPSAEGRGRIVPGALGYYLNVSNNVANNDRKVAIFSAACTTGNGISILPVNYKDVAANFTARKLTPSLWYNDKDEYLPPDKDNDKYKEFENDSIVYSTFHSAAVQSSLRGIELDGNVYDIKNEFFWNSQEFIRELSERFNKSVLIDGDERYVYKLINEIELSNEAKNIISLANDIIEYTFAFRDNDMPWDIGFYQLKQLCGNNDEKIKFFFKEFNEFSNKLRPLVYELKFLESK